MEDIKVTSAVPTYETLLLTYGEGDGAQIATVTLNRPKVLNALNEQVFSELETMFRLLADDVSVRVILLTGAGEKAFAAGADITEFSGKDAAEGERTALRGQGIMRAMETCGKPVIACINGFALGGGCELAMACTLRIASETARLGQPEVKLGLLPGYGGTQRLPRLVGPSAALRLLLTAEAIGAQEALRIGLVDEVVPAEELMERGWVLARKIIAQAPLAVAACIEAVNEGAAMDLDAALAFEGRLFGSLFATEDQKEGVEAFLNKRRPVWKGR